MSRTTRAQMEAAAAAVRAEEEQRLGKLYGSLLPDVLLLRGRDNDVRKELGRGSAGQGRTRAAPARSGSGRAGQGSARRAHRGGPQGWRPCLAEGEALGRCPGAAVGGEGEAGRRGSGVQDQGRAALDRSRSDAAAGVAAARSARRRSALPARDGQGQLGPREPHPARMELAALPADRGRAEGGRGPGRGGQPM